MYTFLLYNNVTKQPEIEFNTWNFDKFYELYWDVLNKELSDTIKTDGELLAKIDWWENEYEFPDGIKPEDVISFVDGKYKFVASDAIKRSLFYKDLRCAIYREALTIRLIHTNLESAVGKPLKTLIIAESGDSDYLNVMREPLYYTTLQTQNVESV